MKRLAFVAALLCPLTGSALPPKLPELPGWFAGCWRVTQDGRRTDEIWLAPADDAMLGMARSTGGGKAGEHEFLRLERMPNADIYYVSHPSGQAPARFRLVTQSETGVVFENPEHDFPTRIVYQHPAPDRLDAYVEGKVDGQTRRIDFPYVRARCPGA